MSDVTRILNAIERGDTRATDELLPLVYEELSLLAAQKLSHEPPPDPPDDRGTARFASGRAGSAGNISPVIRYQDPAASAIPAWTPWNIPMSAFVGVNMRAVKKMIIGVGDRNNPKPGGAGDLYIDDIRLYPALPAQ